jgi:acyl-CoA hydrolase
MTELTSTQRPGRPVKDSISEYAEFALPNDANAMGHVLGGKVMHLVDLAGALAAMRHIRGPVVTASVDHMSFLHPVEIGELIILHASVNRVFRTSMEVGVKVEVEHFRTGTRSHASSAYVTYVAINDRGEGVPAPPVIPETEEQKRRYAEAGERREHRLEIRNRLKRW